MLDILQQAWSTP